MTLRKMYVRFYSRSFCYDSLGEKWAKGITWSTWKLQYHCQSLCHDCFTGQHRSWGLDKDTFSCHLEDLQCGLCKSVSKHDITVWNTIHEGTAGLQKGLYNSGKLFQRQLSYHGLWRCWNKQQQKYGVHIIKPSTSNVPLHVLYMMGQLSALQHDVIFHCRTVSARSNHFLFDALSFWWKPLRGTKPCCTTHFPH